MKKTGICLFVLISFCEVRSQQTISSVVIKPGMNYRLPSNNGTVPLVEPHLAVNPKDGHHMVAAAIAFDSASTSESRSHTILFATTDNGKTWKQTDLPMTVGFDPWLAIRDHNNVALAALAGYSGGHRNGLVCYFSRDGGITWNPTDTVVFGGGHDHPTMSVDTKSQRLYILSSRVRRDSARQINSYAWMNYSDDWKTFRSPSPSFHVGAVNSNTLTINVHPHGNVFIPYVEYKVHDNLPSQPSFKFTTTRDGNKFAEPYIITERAGLSKGFAVSAIAQSGKHKGRSYFVKNTGSTPQRSNGLFLHYSDTLGGRWSDEIRIDHNDAAEKFMRTAAIAVNKDGVVGVAWVDRRNDPGLKKNDIYFTVSVDGGNTFEKEVRVTDVSNDPSTPQNGKAGQRFISGGDYMGCVSKPDGSFQLLWADSRSGVFQLFTANVVVDAK